jgi:hypothetical protein
MKSNAPDIDPANNESLAGTLQFCMQKFMQNMNGMLPARVIKYDRTTNRVQVQLLITLITTQGIQVSRPQIASIPVVLFGGGSYFLSFNLNTGDLGWVLANDRDISLFLQSYKEAPPNTFRINNFSDGVFIPDIMTGYTISEEDSNNAVLQNLDGTIKISLQPNRIKLTAPLVEITGDLQVDGAINGLGGFSISGGIGNSILATGNLRVIGDITASGSITPDVP